MAPITTFFNLTQFLPSSQKVLVTGFFDLLHQEHQLFLRKASQAGNFLIVGVESDYRARLLKGLDRPFQPQLQRASQLAKLDYVDLVVLLPLNFSLSSLRELLLSLIKPQILAVSAHTPNQAQKKNFVQKYGGKLLVVHHHNPQISTTILAKNLYNST